MKQLLLSFILVTTVFSTFGQKNLAPNNKQAQKLENINQVKDIRGVSPLTAFLMLDLKRTDIPKLTEEQLIEKYALIKKEGKIYANSFITIKEDFDTKQLINKGILIGIKKGNILTALIPINQLEALSKNPNINYIQIGEKAELNLDNARVATNANPVHTGTSLPQTYSGEGVVVGIIDIGFDYTHPNFYNNTGTNGYRIKRVWEQNASSGTPPSGFNYGRELKTQSAILAAQRERVNESHGTHVAGIAAGAGGGASTTYKGIAPKADLVFVGTTMTTPAIADGIEYIQNYAASVDKPCVINISFGSHVGPHDGSSLFDRMCDDYFVGEGRILVGSAGNEGSDNLYLNKTFTTIDTTMFTFLQFPYSSLGTNGSAIIDIWGNIGTDFYVGVYIYNTNTDAFEDATPYLYNGAYTGSYSFTLYDDDFWSPDPCYVNIETGVSPLNNKPRVTLLIDNTAQDDNYRYVLLEIKAASTQTKMWASGAIFTNNSYYPPVLSGNSNSTVGEIGGTGKSIISVGAYNTDFSPNGNIAYFSSKGPTADGRTKPDITAPGNRITSSVSRFDTYYETYGPGWSDVVSGVTDGTNTWRFAKMQGTSMASPMVAGIIALWLEMYPDLTPTQAKQIMKSSAITDSYTGSISTLGSNIWGWGKINAWVNIPSLIPPKPTISPSNTNICEGSSITLTAPSGYSAYKWSNGATTQTITVNTPGTYKVKVTNSSGFNSPWSNPKTVVVHSNPPIPTITQDADTLISSTATSYQWYKNGSIINGATGRKYVMTSSGNYKVVVKNSSGCSNESAVLNTSPTNISNIEKQAGIAIYPNPTKLKMNVKFDNSYKNLSYILYDNSGKEVLKGQWGNIQEGAIKTINLENLPNGIYNVKLYNNEASYTIKITVLP